MARSCSRSSSCSVRAPYRTCTPTITNSMKWWLAIFLGLIFFVLAIGAAYNFTAWVWTTMGLPCYLRCDGCPNGWGVFVHALIFILIIRIILW